MPVQMDKTLTVKFRSIFAATYAMVSFWRIWTSGHGIFRKMALMILTLYSQSPSRTPDRLGADLGRPRQPDL
jgi:hypothetical protein